jgi:nucleotide-binding universal stress UspA family protein
MTDGDEGVTRVVVAVDGSDPSRRALERAAIEARAHGARLEVLRAWNYLDQPGPHFDPNFGEDTVKAELEQMVQEVLGGDRPDDMVLLPVNDLPARAVIDAGHGAWMVVLGARGLGGFKGLLLGSVSQQVVNHAPCPVLVVR